MKFGELMSAFGREVGAEGVTPDGEGTCRFQIEGHEVAFTGADECERFVTWAELGELPVNGRSEFMGRLLAAMRVGGEAGDTLFSLFPDTDSLVAYRIMTLPELDLGGFMDGVEAFCGTLGAWRSRLVDFIPSGMKPSPGADSGVVRV